MKTVAWSWGAGSRLWADPWKSGSRGALCSCRRWRTGVAAMRAVNCAPTSEKSLEIEVVKTQPIAGQKTGTSGLRKRTQVLLEEPNFVYNWCQSLFDAIEEDDRRGSTLVLGGDGRFYNDQAAQILLQMAAANGFARVVVGRDALMSTPAVSAAIIQRKALGGLIMTASHNPGGEAGDWGIKYNVSSGSPATEVLLDRVYENTTRIESYRIAHLGGTVDIASTGEKSFGGGSFVVEVVDSSEDHVQVLRRCFDFEELRKLLSRADFRLCFDGMHAASGPSARRVLIEELGAPATSVINGTPLPDFGGGHPDPNLTYAKELVDLMDPQRHPTSAPEFGAASDGDGDRNMILGCGFFVTPSDSLAVIADFAQRAIPFFHRHGLRGVARSMPTSCAVDRVADALGIQCYETPTGWKYFGNLMDAGRVSLCGEESFGTGSDHIREKDGLWAVLAWLSILQYRNANRPIGSFISVEDTVREHWQKYGRNYYMRYDYENVKSSDADALMKNLQEALIRKDADRSKAHGLTLKLADDFEYTDPVDGSRATGQGFRFLYTCGSRIIVRKSGTGSSGATIRIYMERYERDPRKQALETSAALENVVQCALDLTQIEKLTGRTAPTVIT